MLSARWFVLACDFPLATAKAVRQLFDAYHGTLAVASCFTTSGQIEPLFAIWSAEALDALKTNVQKGRTGPVHTLKAIGNVEESAGRRWMYNRIVR